jgi:hypothetical protein
MIAENGAYFIRCRDGICSIVKLHPDHREEILEQGLTRADAETLYFICIGEPVRYEDSTDTAAAEAGRRRRPRQLAFKF